MSGGSCTFIQSIIKVVFQQDLGNRKLVSTFLTWHLRWTKEWICSKRSITICAIVKVWIYQGSRTWPVKWGLLYRFHYRETCAPTVQKTVSQVFRAQLGAKFFCLTCPTGSLPALTCPTLGVKNWKFTSPKEDLYAHLLFRYIFLAQILAQIFPQITKPYEVEMGVEEILIISHQIN